MDKTNEQKSKTMCDFQDQICRSTKIYSAQLGLSDSRISLEMGKDASYLNKLYAKKFMPSIPALCDICDYFDKSVQEFLNPTSRIEQVMMEHLGEEGVELFIQMAQTHPEMVGDMLRTWIHFYCELCGLSPDLSRNH